MKKDLLKYRNNLAFTLAEVLITMAVIGVIAVITIPILINSYQKTQYVTALQKMYSQFNSALIRLTDDYNCQGDLKCTGLFKSTSNALTIGTEIVKYYKVAKNCDTQANQGCMSNSVSPNFDGSGTAANFDSGNWGTGPHYRFITIDGGSMDIVFDQTVDNCSQNKSGGATGNLTETCTWVKFDVNGPSEGPNFQGRDIFTFWLSNGKGPLLYPQGGRDDANSGWWNSGSGGCGINNNGGYKCAARIMEEGWQMKY